MSQVAKPGATGAAPDASVRREAGGAKAKDGEFEKVLEGKAREAGGHAEAGGAATAGSAHEPSARRPGAAVLPEDVGQWRGLPGDLALPARRELAASGQADGARAADAVARIERIAEQLLRAVEVKLGPDGAASARLELDLGGLGSLRVALDRSASGTLAIRFEGASAEAARLLVDHGGQLVERLEARGLALSEVALVSREGPVVRLAPALEAPLADATTRRLAAEAATAERQSDRRGPEDERRGRQPPRLPEEED